MSYENPTPLRVGMTGSLEGWRGRIAGRVVMGIDYEGERYYWNEFNLVDGFGRSSTLVFEEGEDGPEWKFFKPFDPAHAMTAREAASKRVGDTVSLDGIARRVTLVDESRVYHIDGVAPEGVEVGDVAAYFNVDTGERMLVASWTGDEIEFFDGKDVTAQQVRRGFGLSAGSLPDEGRASRSDSAGFSGGGYSEPRRMAPILVISALGAIAAITAYSCVRSNAPRPNISRAAHTVQPVRAARPALELAKGASGTLRGRNYVIEDHIQVAVGRVGSRHPRNEYRLTTETGERALLVNGLNGGTQEWHLLNPVQPPAELTPFDAASVKAGAIVGDRGMMVTALFRSEARPVGANAPIVYYGYLARNSREWLVARWTETQLEFLEGPALEAAEVISALGPGPEAERR